MFDNKFEIIDTVPFPNSSNLEPFENWSNLTPKYKYGFQFSKLKNGTLPNLSNLFPFFVKKRNKPLEEFGNEKILLIISKFVKFGSEPFISKFVKFGTKFLSIFS